MDAALAGAAPCPAYRVVVRLLEGPFDRPGGRLAVYGTLRPGQPCHDRVADLEGTWSRGRVLGRLHTFGLPGGVSYPRLRLDAGGPRVDVDLLDAPDLGARWPALDRFEGPGYRRVITAVAAAASLTVASLYAEPAGCSSG